MSEIKIKRVKVNKFRNILDTECLLNGSNFVFKGNNALGKTNMLNAIYWCLCGVDLNNSSNNNLNIPYDLTKVEGENIVDVELEFDDATTIRRVITIEENKPIQKLCIDNVWSDTLTNGELAIQKICGTLSLEINNKTKVDVLRLLLNPLYFTYLAPCEFRKFVLNLIKEDVSKELVFSKLSQQTQKILFELPLTEFDIELYSMTNDKAIKEIKESIETLTINNEFLRSGLFNAYAKFDDICNYVKDNLKTTRKALVEEQEKAIAVKEYVDLLSHAYQDAISKHFGDIEFCLYEKGIGENVWKSVCYPYISKSKIPFAYGSTSERIIVACKFIKALADDLKLTHLPILIDEYETIDNVNINNLKLDNHQLVVAKVESGLTEMKGETI